MISGVVQVRFEVVRAPSNRLSQGACGKTSNGPQMILLIALLVQQDDLEDLVLSQCQELDDTSTS